MRLDDLQESGDVEDRRGEGGGGGGFPIGGGGIGIGTIVVLGLIGWALGIDPSILIGGAEIFHRGRLAPARRPPRPGPRRTGTPQDDMGRFVSKVLGSTEVQWKQVFSKEGKTYRAPILVLYNGRTRADCGGVAQSAMGPFSARPTRRSISTPRSSTRSRPASVVATSAARPASSPRPTSSPTKSVTTCRTCSASCRRPSGPGAVRRRGRGEPNRRSGGAAGRLPRRRLGEPRERGPAAPASRPSSSPATSKPPAKRRCDRRRPVAEQVAGYVVPDTFTHGSAEQRQRWFHDRAPVRVGRELQHVQHRAAVG